MNILMIKNQTKKETIMKRIKLKQQINNILIIFLLTILTTVVMGEKAKEDKESSESSGEKGKVKWEEIDIDYQELREKIIKVYKKLKKGGIELESGEIAVMASYFKFIIKDPEFEKKTRVRKSWVVKFIKIIDTISKVKTELYLAKRNHETQKYKTAKAQFPKLLKQYKYLIKNPDKIKKKKK